MKGKFLTVFLSLVCVIVCAFGLAACDFGGNSNGDKLDVAGYSYTFSSVDVKCEDENMKALAEMIKEQTKQQMQGNTISFFKDSTCSLTDGADVTYGTYTQNGNKGTITFNGETNNISITENSISLSNIQQGITVIAVFTKGAGGNKPNQPEKPDEPQKPDKCEHIYDKYEIANEKEHIAYCVKCYDKKIEEHRFDGNVCICGYKYGEECNHYFIYEEYDKEIHIAYCYKCQTRIQEEHSFIDGEYCVCGMRKPVDEHRHVWSQTWETSDTHHWHNCTDKTCNEKNGYAKHDFANGDCVCGKAKLQPTEGLEYKLNIDKQSYSVIGIGTAAANKIIFPSEYEGKPVTSIGDSAFRDSGLTSVTIPESVTSIGDYAFYKCSNLTSVTIPESVTSIGSYAFEWCNGLDNIYYIGNITNWCRINGLGDLMKVGKSDRTLYIDGKAIIGELTIPDNITSICEAAFFGCSGLTSITIPDGTVSIGEAAFYRCNGLADIYIGKSVTRIENYVFSYCSNLKNITVSENNTTYASQNGILYNKAKTEFIHVPKAIKGAITIPDSVTSISNSAFSGCSSLTSITIPDSVTSIGDYAFYKCSNLTSVTIPDSVTSIGNSAFRDSGLTSITIPDSVTNIGGYAFEGCSSLTSVIIPDSVTSIGGWAFDDCSSLESIYYTGDIASWCGINGLNYLDLSKVYIDNQKLQEMTTITIPNSVTSIGSSAFYGCRNLTSITIPDGVTSIGDSAFSGCSSLTSITIPDSVTSIGDSAFRDSGLTSITIPDSVTNIGDYTFYGCSSLTSVTIPESVTSIGNSAFSGCSNLTSVTIPESVTSIGNSAFSGCSNLTSVTIPDSVTSIGQSAFKGCSSLTSITIPDSVTSIGDSAFRGCSSLTSITIPDGVTSIGYMAFEGCSNLTSVTIPDSVTTIGDYAFYNCYKLSNITFNGTKEQWYAIEKKSSWDEYSNNFTIHCTDGDIAEEN